MKTCFNALIFSFLILLSCNRSADKVVDFIPGTYVLHSEGEYSKARDTLVIGWLNSTTVSIKRNTSFQRKRGAQLLREQHTQENWTGIYDTKDNSIHVARSGKLLTFMPNSNSVLLGTAKYLKIK